MKRSAFIIILIFSIFLTSLSAVQALSGIQTPVEMSTPSITAAASDGGEIWHRGTFTGATGNDYAVSIQSIRQPTITDPGNDSFVLASGTVSDNQKQQEILKMVNKYRGSIPAELVLAVIRQESGEGAFHVDGWNYDSCYRKSEGSWAQPTNGDGIMQVTDASYYHERSGPYTNDPGGYDHAIKDGCDCLKVDYNAYGSFTQTLLHYNSGQDSLYVFLTINQGDRNYVGKIAGQLKMFVPATYGLHSAYLVDVLNEGQGIINGYVFNKGIAAGQSRDYYKPYQIQLDNALHTIENSVINKPSIQLTSPNGGETWKRGTPQTVTWDYSGSPGSTVKIVLAKGGVEVGTIRVSTSIGTGGHGSYTWVINPSGTTGSDYKVKVQSISQPSIQDTSNNYFTLSPAGINLPSITVTSLNGGEILKRGTTQTVRWRYTGNPGPYVKVVLVEGSTEVGTATYSTSTATGSYQWAISSGRAPGNDYKIKVQSVNNPTIQDTSNGFFTITS